MGLFALGDEARAWMVAAVAAAARELGVFALLQTRGPLDAEAIAAALDLPARRLRPLLDVLAATGALVAATPEARTAAAAETRAAAAAEARAAATAEPRVAAEAETRRAAAAEARAVAAAEVRAAAAAEARAAAAAEARAAAAAETRVAAATRARFAVGAEPPPLVLPPHGWGRLPDVVRRDRPLPDDDALPSFHAHLRAAGAAPARALAAALAALPTATRGLLDLGGGAGAYSEAFAARLPSAPVTLVDRAPVIALARPHLDGRATLIAADLLDDATPFAEHGLALLANVLHLHGASDCARLIARAAASVCVDGWVIVKDLFVAVDRSGPLESLLFAVNMALYTDGGDVYDRDRIAAWLDGAGLADVTSDIRDDELIIRGRRRA